MNKKRFSSFRTVRVSKDKERLFNDDEYLAYRRSRKYQGGFSKDVASSHEFVRYASGKHPCGYIGSSDRSPERDRILEDALRATGLEDEGIGCWLTSGTGRHLADDPCSTLNEWRKRVAEYTDNAFLDVTIWSHPDHGGSWASTQKLREKLLSLCKTVQA